jgi:hypothetical protein
LCEYELQRENRKDDQWKFHGATGWVVSNAAKPFAKGQITTERQTDFDCIDAAPEEAMSGFGKTKLPISP